MTQMERDISRIAVRASKAAEMFDVSKPTFLQWAKRADFTAGFSVGGCTLYSVDLLREWAQKMAKEQAGR